MFDAFMKIDGISGESTDEKHIDWIEILSMQFGLSRDSALSTKTSQRVKITDVTVSKYTDLASVLLNLSIIQRRSHDNVTIEFCRAGGDKFVYLRILLTDVFVMRVDTNALAKSQDNLPVETVALSFREVTWEYTKQGRADGTGRGAIFATHNLAEPE
ncbi:MAG: type VI secretion system tube protein Hcp [Bryobacteraceae bacterium]